MPLAVFFHANADEDHGHDEGNDAFFFGGKDEEIHRLPWIAWSAVAAEARVSRRKKSSAAQRRMRC